MIMIKDHRYYGIKLVKNYHMCPMVIIIKFTWINMKFESRCTKPPFDETIFTVWSRNMLHEP
jgi:hypothetical protein